MPLYEYECASCGRRTEALQRFVDAPITECPHCGGALRKLVSAPSFQFKGSGWYVTDYARKSGDAETGGAETGGKSESSAPTAEKSDKPADKTADKSAPPAGSTSETKPPASTPAPTKD